MRLSGLFHGAFLHAEIAGRRQWKVCRAYGTPRLYILNRVLVPFLGLSRAQVTVSSSIVEHNS